MKQKSNPPCDYQSYRLLFQPDFLSLKKSLKLISNSTRTSLQTVSRNFAAWHFSVNLGVVRVIPWASLGSDIEEQDVTDPIPCPQ